MSYSGKEAKDAGAGLPLTADLAETLRGTLKEFEHFPINGIRFKDISPVLAARGALTDAVSALMPSIAALDVEAVLGIDARGFVLGAALADRLRSGLIMVRKPGKLPGEVQSFDYTCEYCAGQLQITKGLVGKRLRCLIVDDLLATGGTARATANFVKSQEGKVVGYAFMLEINALNGRKQLNDAPVVSVMRC
jgi:adenine phosphoribosyltransferase